LDILFSVKEHYEKHHRVRYSDETIHAIVKLTARYMTDKNFPDKAIDVLDESGSKVHLANIVVPPEIIELEKEVEEIKREKESLAKLQNFENAAKLRDVERNLTTNLEFAREAWEKTENDKAVDVTEEDIADVVSMITGVPTQKLAISESSKLAEMDKILSNEVIGQDEAISVIAKAIRRARAGLKDPNRPIGSLIFLGPTGVGKTYLAKKLSEFLFESENSLIRVDMSEYMEKFTVSRLMGSPPGYIGYEEGGLLTEKVRRRPYSVILLDEIEKAHPDVFNLLLQVLDEGHLTDSLGHKVDFKNTVLIMTSNIGVKDIKNSNSFGFTNTNIEDQSENIKSKISEELKKAFNPEFLNRLDDIVYFKQLKAEEAVKIVQISLTELETKLEEKGIKIQLTDGAKKFLTEKGFDPLYGARPLKRAIQKYIEDPLADELIKGNYPDGSEIQVKVKNKNELKFIIMNQKNDHSININ
jgi:ATP-dependent Clp protease ATP-binding subunit ClpC